MLRKTVLAASALALSACNGGAEAEAQTGNAQFNITPAGTFNEPWAMTFLPNSKKALVTEKRGKLLIWSEKKPPIEVTGVPTVAYGGQGGLGDVILHPNFAQNGMIYLSFAESGQGGFGAAVARANLDLTTATPNLKNVEIIWRQTPKVSGQGHYGHRLTFGPDGKLYISSGDRQKFEPAQDMAQNLGKIVRLNDDGTVPSDNPFYNQGPVQAQIWSLGHRNPLGITFDNNGNLWNQEMGPQGGDEVNFVKRGANYGYPRVSNGSHYGGGDIPDHAPGDGFEAPKAWWNPAISPGGLLFYTGTLFPKWKNSLFLGGLGSRSLIRLKVNGEQAAKADQWSMGARIREVEQGPDGALWLLEDGPNGRLLKLTPKV
jgi:aldose sugar dehydrogenase